MSLCFYIIYTPNTVKPLQLLLYSLLKWSDCSFCLVTNGCSTDEARMLQALCTGNPRLSYQALPTRQMMLHGDALNLLQAQTQGDYFCFMDSDIYAVAEFMPDFLPMLEKYSGVFSGMPLRYPQGGLSLPTGKSFWAGPYTHSPTGLCLGATFFAIYNNRVLTEIRRKTGISFTKYRWETIPAAYQAQIEALGLRHEVYDTAKVLNLVLHLHGHALHQQPCPALHHIEAVSRFAVIQSIPWWRRWSATMSRYRRQLRGERPKLTYDQALPHLSQILLALTYGEPLPSLSHDITQSSPWVVQAQAELLALQAEFAQQRGRR